MLPQFFLDFGSGNTEPGIHWLPGMTAVVLIGVIVYHIVCFRLFRALITHLYSKCSWWEYLTTYKGILCPDVQKEIQYTTILGIHHILGGGMMAYGAAYAAPPVWTLGALVSMIDDVHDVLCIILPAWPFGGPGGRDVKLCTVLLIHHVAAILGTFPAICAGLGTNVHVQSVGAALLLAGGCSHVVLTTSRTRNRKIPREAWHDALIWIVGTSFYMYSRFYIFPRAMIALYHEDYPSMSPGMQDAFLGFLVLMSLFNVVIGLDAASGTLKRIGIALSGGEKKRLD